MRAESQPSGQQMMLSINAWSSVYLVLAMTITGEGVSFCDFCTRHPVVLVNVALLSACAAIGQLFIYTTVSHDKHFLRTMIDLIFVSGFRFRSIAGINNYNHKKILYGSSFCDLFRQSFNCYSVDRREYCFY